MMPAEERPLVWLHGEIRSPPFSKAARIEAGLLLRRLQDGERIGLPHSRPMPSLGPRCHELRILDAGAAWRIVYRLDADAVLILAVFAKQTRRTPRAVIQACRQRIQRYEQQG
jgi:phage-related protein